MATSLKRETLKIFAKEFPGISTAQRNCQVERDSQRKEGLGGIEDFSTKQSHFSGMYQERADKDLPRLCESSNGEQVNVMRSQGGSFSQVPRTDLQGVTLRT